MPWSHLPFSHNIVFILGKTNIHASLNKHQCSDVNTTLININYPHTVPNMPTLYLNNRNYTKILTHMSQLCY